MNKEKLLEKAKYFVEHGDFTDSKNTVTCSEENIECCDCPANFYLNNNIGCGSSLRSTKEFFQNYIKENELKEDKVKLDIKDNEGDIIVNFIDAVKNTLEIEEKPQTMKEYLLERIKRIEVHQKEHNRIAEEGIKEAYNQLSIGFAHINDCGNYVLSSYNLNSKEAELFAEFQKRMESPK